jgi:hypothetical protein
MRTMLLAVVLSAGVGFLAGPNASAAPAVGTPIARMADQASAMIHVVGGCARGWHRGPRGRCTPGSR